MTDLEKKLFDTDATFDVDYYEYMAPHRDTVHDTSFIFDALDITPIDTVLEIGTGNGRLLRGLRERGVTNLTGIDFSHDVLMQARAAEYADSITYLEGDFLHHTFDRNYDKIVSFFSSFGYMDDATNARILEKVATLLTPSGRFLLDIPGEGYANNVRAGATRIEEDRDGVHTVWDATLREGDIYYDSTCTVTDSKKGMHKTYHFVMRLYQHAEMIELLERAGLTVVQTYGSYRLHPLAPTSKRAIYIAKRAA
jgi:SAM-dependent methyltransferase